MSIVKPLLQRLLTNLDCIKRKQETTLAKGDASESLQPIIPKGTHSADPKHCPAVPSDTVTSPLYPHKELRVIPPPKESVRSRNAFSQGSESISTPRETPHTSEKASFSESNDASHSPASAPASLQEQPLPSHSSTSAPVSLQEQPLPQPDSPILYPTAGGTPAVISLASSSDHSSGTAPVSLQEQPLPSHPRAPAPVSLQVQPLPSHSSASAPVSLQEQPLPSHSPAPAPVSLQEQPLPSHSSAPAPVSLKERSVPQPDSPILHPTASGTPAVISPASSPAGYDATNVRSRSSSPGVGRGARDKLCATETKQKDRHRFFPVFSRLFLALLGAFAVVVLLLAAALFTGTIRLSGRCAVPPGSMHATLYRWVERGISHIELPTAPSVHRQHNASTNVTIDTFNTSLRALRALRVGSIEVAACHPDGRTYFDRIPPKVVVRLSAVETTAPLWYGEAAMLGELLLEFDLEPLASGTLNGTWTGKATSCGGELQVVDLTAATSTVQMNETSAASSDIAQTICYGSVESGSGAPSETSGLVGTLTEGMREAMPELRREVEAAVDQKLLMLLALTMLLPLAGCCCMLGLGPGASIGLRSGPPLF